MPTVFADAGYFIAKLNGRDPLHNRAVEVAEGLGGFRIVTTQMVLTEVINYMSDGGEFLRMLASQMIANLLANPGVEVIPQTEAQFIAAAERYAARRDQRWSLTDCASFLVMEERNMMEALAHDRNFEQAGFVALMREDRARRYRAGQFRGYSAEPRSREESNLPIQSLCVSLRFSAPLR